MNDQENGIEYMPSGQASVEELQRKLQTTQIVAAVGVGSAVVLGILAISQYATKKAAVTIAERNAYQDIVRSTGGIRGGLGYIPTR